jgi:prophage tail gpP-like protein
MSKKHTVKPGEVLINISIKHYGVPNKYNLIIKANPQLAGRPKASDGSPFIHTGDVLIIPDETENIVNPTQKEKIPETIENVSDNAISILIDGQLFSFWTDYSITFEIDTFDTFSFSAPFDSDLKIYRDVFRPFNYKPIAIYYGQDLIFTGTLLADESTLEPEEKSISITGYSKPGILSDCHMPISSFPLEFNNQNLKQIALIVCKPYGITPVFLSSVGNPFEKVSIDLETDIFSFLSDLAEQRDLLISNNEKGELVFYKTQTKNSVASFKQGELPLISCNPSFDSQSFYSHITGVTQTTEEKKSVSYTYENKYLINQGIMRCYNFTAEDTKDSEIKQATLARAGRMFGESVSYELRIAGHRDKNGELLKKNTIVSVFARGAMIYRETDFLIKSLTMTRDDGGNATEMELVLPGAYSGQIPEVFPWEE